MRIAMKLPLLIVGFAAAAAVVTGTLGFLKGRSALIHSTEERLVAVRESRANNLRDYLASIERDASLLARTDLVVQGLEDLESRWAGLDAPRETLQRQYITDNPHPLGQKDKLVIAETDPYGVVHEALHPPLRNWQDTQGYYDLFIIDHDGNIPYSVFKERDYATNLFEGQYADSGLAQAVREVKGAFRQGKTAFSDFSPYAPSDGAPASFMAVPVFDRAGEEHGYVAVQMPIKRINQVMQEQAGLGESGETYPGLFTGIGGCSVRS